jgi:hypothetical protein
MKDKIDIFLDDLLKWAAVMLLLAFLGCVGKACQAAHTTFIEPMIGGEG